MVCIVNIQYNLFLVLHKVMLLGLQHPVLHSHSRRQLFLQCLILVPQSIEPYKILVDGDEVAVEQWGRDEG